MNDGLPTDDVTLDSMVLCPECGGKGWSDFSGCDLDVWVTRCPLCDGDGIVPLYWAMENVA